MSLEVRRYKFEENHSHDIFEVELIPEVVDGVNVYNVQAVITDHTGIAKTNKTNKIHYGYFSEAMADFLDQKNQYGIANIEKVFFKSLIKYPDEITNLSQKIIIDRHPEAEDSIPDISLEATKYSKKLEPTITVAIKNFFNITTGDTPVIFKLNDNKLLCDSFYIIGTNDEGTTTIDLNIENNRAGIVSINRVQPIRALSKDAYFSFSGGEECKIDIKTLVVPAKSDNGEVLKIKARDGIEVFSSSLRLLTNASDIGGELNVEGHLSLVMAMLDFDNFDPENRPSLSIKGDCKLENMDCQVKKDNNFENSFIFSKSKGGQGLKSKAFICKADVKSPLEIQPDPEKGLNLTINQSMIDNKNKKVFLRGEEVVFYKSHVQNDGVEGLQIRNSHFVCSKAINTKIFSNSRLFRTNMENCIILNEGTDKKGVIKAAPIFIGSIDERYNETLVEETPMPSPILSIKDSKIELGKDEAFDMRNSAEAEVKNTNFNGSFNLSAPVASKIDIKNSIFNNANIQISSAPKVEIKNSEINNNLKATSLTHIESSVISNSKIEDTSRVENSFIEDISIFNSPFSEIKNYNSKIDKELPVEGNNIATNNKDIEFL